MKFDLVVISTLVACLNLSRAIEVDITTDIEADVDANAERRKKNYAKYREFEGEKGKKLTPKLRNKDDPESGNFRTSLGSTYWDTCDRYVKKTDFYRTINAISDVDVECYTIIGGNGYYLQIFRIQPPSSVTKKDQPIHLVHNWGSTSDVWTVKETPGSPAQSFALFYANQGWDVWMHNSRGNGYSEGHMYYDELCKEYWDFSWGDIAYWDLPCEWEFIDEITGKKPIPLGNGMGAQEIAAALGMFENDYGSDSSNLVKGGVFINMTTNMVKDSSCGTGESEVCNKIYFDALDISDGLESETLYESLQCNGFLVQGVVDTSKDDDYNDYRQCGNRQIVDELEEFFTEYVAEQYESDLDDLYEPIVAKATSKAIVHRLQNSEPATGDIGKFYDFEEGTAYKNRCIYGTSTPPKFRGSDLDDYNIAFFGGYDGSSDLDEIGPQQNARAYCNDAKNVWFKQGTSPKYIRYTGDVMDIYKKTSATGLVYAGIDLALIDIKDNNTARFNDGTCDFIST